MGDDRPVEDRGSLAATEKTTPPRLLPPLRPASPGGSTPSIAPAPFVPGRPPGRVSSAAAGFWRWLTTAGLLALLGVAAAVFVLLPRWVEEHRPAEPEQVAPAVVEAPDPPRAAVAEPPRVEAAPEAPEPAAAPAPQAPPRPVRQPPELAERRGDDGAFVAAMSEGLAALERREHTAAREAFQRAQELRPGAREPADGLLRAEQGLRLAAIAARREMAVAAEAEENWGVAAEHYTAVLAIDPDVELAREGEARCQVRAELAARLDFHIANPQRLSSEPVLAEASRLLARAAAIEPAGPVLRRQVEQLERRLALASTPVRALLRSDNLTEVAVHQVGHLGRFDHRQLELRPGTYTVVGSRDGYRDVRHRLVIVPGEAPEPLVVRCEEEI